MRRYYFIQNIIDSVIHTGYTAYTKAMPIGPYKSWVVQPTIVMYDPEKLELDHV